MDHKPLYVELAGEIRKLHTLGSLLIKKIFTSKLFFIRKNDLKKYITQPSR